MILDPKILGSDMYSVEYIVERARSWAMWLLKLYVYGFITEDELRNALSMLGFAPKAIELLVLSALVERLDP